MSDRLIWGGACVLAVAALACASNPAPRKPAQYTRSPALDYVQQPRSASDDEVIGAQRQSPGDWILVQPTNEHAAIGWETQYGRFQFRREGARAGYGAMSEELRCDPPLAAPVRPEGEVRARATLHRNWLEAQQPPRHVAGTSPATAEVATAQPDLLACNR